MSETTRAPMAPGSRIMEISGSRQTMLFVSWTNSFGTPWRQEPINIPEGYKAEIYLVKEVPHAN